MSDLPYSKQYRWVTRDTKMSHFEKLLYTRLTGYCMGSDHCWPSERTLAVAMGTSRAQIQRGLKRLEQLKYIKVKQRWKGKERRSDDYYFPVKADGEYSKQFHWLTAAQGFSALEKQLYTRLVGYQGDGQVVWPSSRTLAEELGAHRAQVQRGLRKLEEVGLIEVHRECMDGLWDSNYYVLPTHPLMVSKWVEMSQAEDLENTSIESDSYEDEEWRSGGSTLATPWVHPGAPAGPGGGAPAGPEEENTLKRKVKKKSEEENLGSLRSPLADSLRSSAGSLTVDWTSPSWGSSPDFGVPPGGPFPLPQMPASGPVGSVVSVPVFNSTSDLAARLAGLQDVVAAAKAKNRAEQTRKAEKAAKKTQALKNLKGGAVPASIGRRLNALEARWREEFHACYPNDIIAKVWGGKEKGQLKHLLGAYADQDVLNGITFYIRHFKKLAERYKFRGTLPGLGHFVTLQSMLIPEAKKTLDAFEAHARYHAWQKANEMSYEPTPKALQAEYDAVKDVLKTYGLA